MPPTSPTRDGPRSGHVLGRSLAALRRSLGVTQVELARRMSVTQATISKYESSEPTMSTARRYLEALDGRLELVAVFGDDRTRLDEDPPGPAAGAALTGKKRR